MVTGLIKFCVSVSWRVLSYLRTRTPRSNHEYTATQLELIESAERRWRAFLQGEERHPGIFEQHLLIFDAIESTSASGLPNNFNRFMTGVTTFDIVGSRKSVMSFAKLGRFMVFGMIEKGPHTWKGTKVHLRRGELKPGEYVVPGGLLDLLKPKAAYTNTAMQRMSPAQFEKIDNHIVRDLDRFRASDQFRSIM